MVEWSRVKIILEMKDGSSREYIVTEKGEIVSWRKTGSKTVYYDVVEDCIACLKQVLDHLIKSRYSSAGREP